MSRTVRKQIFKKLEELCSENQKIITDVIAEAQLQDTLARCQNMAVDIGTQIETVYGEGFDCVHGLEDYCELIYKTAVEQDMKKREDNLSDYLYKDKKTNMVSVVNKNHKDAKDAKLSYKTLASNNGFSLVEIDLQTGRPHQIRVQFSSRNHPLYGDQRYGKNVNKKGQQIALWSYKIEIEHPTKKEKMEFICEPPNKYPWNMF